MAMETYSSQDLTRRLSEWDSVSGNFYISPFYMECNYVSCV